MVTRIWTIDGHRPLQPAPIAEVAVEYGWPTDWLGIVNGVACPRGRAWGEANFLVSQATLDQIDINGSALDIACEHEDGTTTWVGYYAIRTQAITQNPDNHAHWITLADRRWVLEKVAANNRYNLRNSDSGYVTSSLNGGVVPYTWQAVLNNLWATLPSAIAGTGPTLPFTPFTTPENLVFDGFGAWRAINQVLTAIGCCVVLNPFTGVFSYVNLNSTQTGLATFRDDYRSRLLWQYSPEQLPRHNYPANVVVTFHKRPGSSTADDPFTILPDTSTVGTGSGRISGTSIPIVDTMFSTSLNAATRAARAAEIRDAVCGLLRPMDDPWGEVYSGIVEVPIGAQVTDATWIDDGSNGTRTIAQFSCPSISIDWPQLLLGDVIGGFQIQVTRFTLTADLAGTYLATATATDGVNSITVTNPGEFRAFTGATGMAVGVVNGTQWIVVVNQPAQRVYAVLDAHPNDSGGNNRRYGADPRETNCAIKTSPAPYALTPYPFSFMPTIGTAVLNPDDMFGEDGDGCLLTWDKTTDAYRLTAVYPQRQQAMWMLLTANRGLGFAATVAASMLTPASHGDNPGSVEISDVFNVLINGKSGNKVFVVWDAKEAKYIAIEGQHDARQVRGTLNGSFTGTPPTFLVSVVSGMDGGAPISPITVQNRFNWPSGTSGHAIEVRWDTHDGNWYPIQMRWECPE